MSLILTDDHLFRSRNDIVCGARCSRSTSDVVITECIENRSSQFAGKVRSIVIADSFQVFLLAILLVLEEMVHIRHLREKIEEEPSNPIYIKTVKGRGYMFNDDIQREYKI